jgi:tetratricopeptide (TPR) repeat protein
MRWLVSEYILKGIFLGLLLFVALQEPDWTQTGQVALFTAGGLAVFLGIAAWLKLREGYKAQGRAPAFILFLLLESPGLVYAGILLGLAAGAYSIGRPENEVWLKYTFAGGVVLGILFWLLRRVENRWIRLGLSLALAGALVGGAVLWLHHSTVFLEDQAGRTRFGTLLLLGLPFFYLLTFAGAAEESEIEIGAMCAALGLGICLLEWERRSFQSTGLLLTLLLYFVYTMRVLPGLRVFKHVVRGLSYAHIGRYRPALQAFQRALQLDPKNSLARECLWSVHGKMDLKQVSQEPQTLALVDFDLCLERASSLLLEPGPTAAKLQEANHLLDLIEAQRPAMKPAVDYWRAVAHTHGRNYEQAAADLERVFASSGYPSDDPQRRRVLFSAWQLALTLHPEMNRRVGTPQLAIPGRRMEAIAAVERHLADNAGDPAGWELKRLLYSTLTEADYEAAAGKDEPAIDFDHDYTQQLGLALINDPGRWQRGAAYLQMAARGLPAHAPWILLQAAQAYQRAGNAEEVWNHYELAKKAGRRTGAQNLDPESKHAYFEIVKLLGEDARSRDDVDQAIENYQLYAENERSGLETLRILAELYEKRGDVFGALFASEKALIYSPKDKDLLEKKDRYYYSVMPEDLRARLESVRKGFDVGYCLKKARALLDTKDADLDLIDWAQHLTELARIILPESLTAKMLLARALRRRGEIDQYRAILEEVYSHKPEKFASGEDEDAWFLSSRLLGETYLYELGRPELAVSCFNAFRKSSKSGADTLYKLGQAYEQLGDPVRAKKCYEHVITYDRHPLAPEAREALYRLQSN